MMHSMYGLFGGGFNMMFGGLFWLVLIIIFLYLLFRKVMKIIRTTIRVQENSQR